jgi:hypothetical protein
VSIVLAATWDPRGELARLERLMPLLRGWYAAQVVTVPGKTDDRLMLCLEALGIQAQRAEPWTTGRYRALEAAVRFEAAHIHYADLDRLIRWAETRPDELRGVLDVLQTADALIIGRTARAMATHPAALQQSERTVNAVFSHLLGQPLDLPAGSKGFSQRAARYLLARTLPEHGLGTDATWPVLLARGGFRLATLEADGLDWETPDRYLTTAADARLQAEAALIYDAAPDHWRYRVDLAHHIITAGLHAWVQPLDLETEGNPV